MCGGGSSSDSNAVSKANSDAQLAASQEQAAASLAQQQRIADAQAAANERQFQYQKDQDNRRLLEANQQAARQETWDTTRGKAAADATQQVNDAFGQFSPDYFKQYADASYNNANGEITRQAGVAQKNLAFGLARQGIVDSTAAADQQGLLGETTGRAQTDARNQADTAAKTLETNTGNQKTSLLGQVLSSNTLGNPIAASSDAGVASQIDTANRAISGISTSATDYAAAIQQPQASPSVGTALFGNILGTAANAVSGQTDAKITAGVGGTTPGATGTGSSVKIYGGR